MPAARSRKRGLHELTHGTMIKDVNGVTPETLQDLALAGYNVRSRTTLREFSKITEGYEPMAKRMREMSIDGSRTMTKMKSIWDNMPGAKSTDPTLNMEAASDIEGDTRKKNNKAAGILLSPQEAEEQKSPEEIHNKMVPEVSALQRHPDPDKAVAMGYVTGGPQFSVVPDQTLVVSPDDKNVSLPTEVFPETPVPIIPGFSIGQHIARARMVAPMTLEEKQIQQASEAELPSIKASGEKDIGSDAYGILSIDDRVGRNAVMPEDGSGEGEGGTRGRGGGSSDDPNGMFKARHVDEVFGQNKEGAEKPDQSAEQDMKDLKTGSMHPFKQPSLFKNHDEKIRRAKLIHETTQERDTLRRARMVQSVIEQSDESWYRTNPATQGVDVPFMPQHSANVLARNVWTTDNQMSGAMPFVDELPPCPWAWQQITGRFR